jgi:hypothetical protein
MFLTINVRLSTAHLMAHAQADGRRRFERDDVGNGQSAWHDSCG